MKNLIKAVLAVMADVKGIDKNLTVGTGQYSYKGVSDKDVKIIIGESMQKNGLTIFPIKIEPQTTTERWEETNQYGTKTKQQTHVEVKTTYLLAHESGESIEIQGYGHGVDSQDKAAGKATTYALKYALLYQFLVPTGHIDDTDKTHSQDQTVPKKQNPLIKKGSAVHEQMINWIEAGGSVEKVKEKYSLSAEMEKEMIALEKKTKEVANVG